MRLKQIFEDSSFLYLIMDLHEGGTLTELISNNKLNYLSEEISLTIIE